MLYLQEEVELILEMSRWNCIWTTEKERPGPQMHKFPPPRHAPNLSICPNDFSLSGNGGVVCLGGLRGAEVAVYLLISYVTGCPRSRAAWMQSAGNSVVFDISAKMTCISVDAFGL